LVEALFLKKEPGGITKVETIRLRMPLVPSGLSMSEERYRVYGQTLKTAEDFDGLLPLSQNRETLLYEIVRVAPDWLWEDEKTRCCDSQRSGMLSAYRLDFADIGTYNITPKSIVCYPRRDIDLITLKNDLLGNAFSIWFELQGIFALHASAIVLNQHAFGFISNSGNGKSTLAAALLQAGCALLTDDILPIQDMSCSFVALPGYPRVRLWENEAQFFLGHFQDLAPVHPKIAKRWVPVGVGQWGAFCDNPQPLARLYLPERRDPASDDYRVTITPMSPRDALIELVRHSFAALTVEAIGLHKRRLDALGRLASQIPMRRIIYPSGFDYLPRVSAAIVEDFET